MPKLFQALQVYTYNKQISWSTKSKSPLVYLFAWGAVYARMPTKKEWRFPTINYRLVHGLFSGKLALSVIRLSKTEAQLCSGSKRGIRDLARRWPSKWKRPWAWAVSICLRWLSGGSKCCVSCPEAIAQSCVVLGAWLNFIFPQTD